MSNSRSLVSLLSPACAAALLLASPVGSAAQVVINEIDYDQPGTDAAEFVEIKNTGPTAVDLATLSLRLVNGNGGAVYASFDLPAGTLAPGGYFVVCGDAGNVPGCDLDVSPDTNLIQNGAPDAVALYASGLLADAVSYEGSVPGFVEGSGAGLEDDPGVEFRGVARFPDGVDSDRNDVDLSPRCITPGAPNGEAASDCAAPGNAVLVINEVDYDQPGTDAAEFVELLNVGSAPAALESYELQLVNGAGGGAAVYAAIALPAVQLAPGGYFVVCGDASQVPACDLDVTPDTNLIQNGGPDAVALLLGGAVVDALSYEGTTPGFSEGSGVGLADLSSLEFSGLSRFPDGTDTDQNNIDFSPRCISPGRENLSDSDACGDPRPARLVINELDYDQPGTDEAEFVEIKNTGAEPIDLDGYVLQLVNGTGGGATLYGTVALPALSLAAGDYFVICGDASRVPNCDLDASPDTNLIQNGAPDAVALSFGAAVVDTVSYEGVTGAPYTEGAGAPDDPSGEELVGLSRLPDGADTDRNDLDFSVRCITPGEANSSATSGCLPPLPPVDATIAEIQGPGLVSPLLDRIATTRGNVVTAVAPDGFFIQSPPGLDDGDSETSEGVFVFTGGPSPSVGDLVDVTGRVREFFELTELGAAPAFTVLASGQTLPEPVRLDAGLPSPLAPQSPTELERFEGMLVQVRGGAVSSGNQRFGSDPVAEVFVVAGPMRAFREPGIEFPGQPGLPVWDGNPELFELDPDRLGLPNVAIPAGSSFDALGVLGFEFGGYELWPVALEVREAELPRPVRAKRPGEFALASLNLFRLFDPIDDPGPEDDGQALDPGEYARRLGKVSCYVRELLGAPEVLAVQEVEKLGVLEDLAGRLADDDPGLVYRAHLEEGNDRGGIDVGFLTRDTVAVDGVLQLAASETLSVDGTLLHDRPPLLLQARYTGNGAPFPFRVLGLHNRSLGGIEDPADGPRVRQKRLEQAQSVARIVQELQLEDPRVRLVVIGDFNAFEFSDGYVDVVGQIAGDFDPAQSLLDGPDLVEPNLRNQVLDLPAQERYSFVFRGSAQTLDHALASQAMQRWARGLEFARGNADAAADLIDDGLTPLRSSDHDGLALFVMSDADGDGVADDRDRCAATRIPEGVPERRLGVFRFALVDDDDVFDSRPPNGVQPPRITLDDTAGCSCEQIIERLHLGHGHERFGCALGVLERWIRDSQDEAPNP